MVILENCDQLSRQGKRHYPVDLNILLMIAVYAGTTCITIRDWFIIFRDDLFLTALYFFPYSNFFLPKIEHRDCAYTCSRNDTESSSVNNATETRITLIFDDTRYWKWIYLFILVDETKFLKFYFVVLINLYILISYDITVNFVRSKAWKNISRK